MRYSYTTINDLYIAPHSFVNKLFDVQKPENDDQRRGKTIHAILQDHYTKKVVLPQLVDAGLFITAETDIEKTYRGKVFHGKPDLINGDTGTIGEIKTAESFWSQQRFDNLIQWKYYGWLGNFDGAKLITVRATFLEAYKVPTSRLNDFIRSYYRPIGKENEDTVRAWLDPAIDLIESGKFTDDLVDGKCINPRCPYGKNCRFI